MKKKIIALIVILAAGAGLYLAYRANEVGPPAPVTSEATFAELWADEGSGIRSQEPEAENSTGSAESATTAAPVFNARTAGITAAAPTTTTTAAATTTATIAPASGDPKAQYAYAGVYQGINPQVAAVPGDPYLIFVSRESALPQGYSGKVKLAACVPGYDHQMESTAAAQYRKMFDAGKADGVTLAPYSGYRSTQRQKNNFENKIKSYENGGKGREAAVMAASQSILPPGCSEHEAGLAMDIVSTDANFKDTKEYKWLVENAHNYGFILRYPSGKTNITLVKYEPWHWRYVGIEHATKMKETGQVLEEYLGLR